MYMYKNYDSTNLHVSTRSKDLNSSQFRVLLLVLTCRISSSRFSALSSFEFDASSDSVFIC